MALYRFAAGLVQRSQGHSSTAASAYRAGVAIVDERTGEVHDYTRRGGVIFTGIYAPAKAPEWARDRAQLWNHAEKAEKRKDARTAREFVIALPHELTPEQNRWLLQDFVKENFTRKGFAADVAIHAPPKDGDDRNFHAHVMVTTRVITPEDFSPKKDRTQNEKATLEAWRESWERLGNRHLERHGFEPTLDRRTYEAQSVDRVARIHMGKAAWNLERRGATSTRGEINESIADYEAERAKLTRELAELEAQQRKEQDEQAQKYRAFQASVAAQERAELAEELEAAEIEDARQARAKIAEMYVQPQHEVISAIDRQREEERAAEVGPRYQGDTAARMILRALWNITKTLGSSLSHIILAADRGSLQQGRRLDFDSIKPQGIPLEKPEPAQANPVTQQRAAQPIEEQRPRPAVRLEAAAKRVIVKADRDAEAADRQKAAEAAAEELFVRYELQSKAPPAFDPKFARETIAATPARIRETMWTELDDPARKAARELERASTPPRFDPKHAREELTPASVSRRPPKVDPKYAREEVGTPARVETPRPAPANAAPWLKERGGYDVLSDEQKEAAQRSYAAWQARQAETAKRRTIEEYVSFVQSKQTARPEDSASPDPREDADFAVRDPRDQKPQHSGQGRKPHRPRR